MERFGTVQELLRTRSRGQMMVLFALAFTVLAGAMGMGADMGAWLVERQHLQTAVDSAAIAGARYYVAGAGQADQLSVAQSKAQEYLDTYQYQTSKFTRHRGEPRLYAATAASVQDYRHQSAEYAAPAIARRPHPALYRPGHRQRRNQGRYLRGAGHYWQHVRG